jgi:DeoR/GlpR family transcriptional regulator of sugar metabolism
LELINDGDVVALEMGTTTWELAKLISQKEWKELHVITNGLPIIDELVKLPGILITCVGGTVDPNELANFGVGAEKMISQFNISKLFIGCRGIQPDRGMTSTGVSEVEIGTIKAFGDASNCIIVLADHTKIGRTYFIQVLPTSKVDILITTDLAPESELQLFKKNGVNVILVPIVSDN